MEEDSLTTAEVRMMLPDKSTGKLELIVLIEHDGEHMYQYDKAAGLWLRLEGECASPHS